MSALIHIFNRVFNHMVEPTPIRVMTPAPVEIQIGPHISSGLTSLVMIILSGPRGNLSLPSCFFNFYGSCREPDNENGGGSLSNAPATFRRTARVRVRILLRSISAVGIQNRAFESDSMAAEVLISLQQQLYGSLHLLLPSQFPSISNLLEEGEEEESSSSSSAKSGHQKMFLFFLIHRFRSPIQSPKPLHRAPHCHRFSSMEQDHLPFDSNWTRP